MNKKQSGQVMGFVRKLNKAFSPSKVILFGSRASGDDWCRSDYDFIIVSEKFRGMHWLERIALVVQLWDSLEDIDVLPYTPEEFEEKKHNSSVVRNAVSQGMTLSA